MGDMLSRHKADIEKWAKSSGLTLKNVFLVCTGDYAKYGALKDDIAIAKQKVEQLGMDIETQQIKQAEVQLDGMVMEVNVRAEKVGVQQRTARGAAGAFGGVVGGDDGTLAMYAAQAYKDLTLFGGEASREHKAKLAPRLGWLGGLLDDTKYTVGKAGSMDEWRDVYEWAVGMGEQQEFLDERLPDWNAKSAAWNQFFAQMTGSGVD
jgi:hypothetical protein